MLQRMDRYIVQAACTSKPWQWNKGKKRTKNPQKLHQAEYSSFSKSQRSDELYKWEPSKTRII